MVSSGIKAATEVQIGKESMRGTAVAATRKLLTSDATYRILEAQENFESQMHGTLARVAVAPVITRRATEFELATDLDFEQLLMFLLSGVKGGVTPTTPGTGEARLWTFTPGVSADPLPDTYTLEFAEQNFDASPDINAYESPYCFTVDIEITGSIDGLAQIRASMVGRRASTTTVTGALGLPTLTYAGNLRWTAYFDATWAGLGGTQIIGQVYGFTWHLSGFLRPEYYLDNRSDLDFSQYQFKPRVVDLSLDVAHDPTAGLFVPAEQANKAAGTMRFVRLKIVGGAFDAPDTGLSRHIELDGAYYHAADSLQERGADRDGVTVARAHLLSAYDSTGAQDFQVAVQNNLATFP